MRTAREFRWVQEGASQSERCRALLRNAAHGGVFMPLTPQERAYEIASTRKALEDGK